MKKLMMVMALLPMIALSEVQFAYEENMDGTIALTDIMGTIPENLVIPATCDGKKVSEIGPGVLAGDEEDGVVPSIKTLIVPEGVRRIGEDSFSRCPYLAKIVLPKSLEEIGEGAFTAGADSLPFNDYKWKDYENFGIREIQVADGNESFEVKDGVLVDRKNGVAVVCCVNATSLSLPEGIREIGEHCFAYCQSLSAIWFPSSLQTIGKEAFMFCRQLKALDFSSTSLSQVGRNAFGGCVNLAGVKFPASLEDVGKNAFYWCNALRSVTYEGDAPSSAEEIYMTTNDDLATPRLLPDAQRKEMPLSKVVSYVPSDSTGWGEVPGVWQGCPVRHEPRIDLEHNYAFETGTWNGWTYAGMEDYRSQDYSGEEDNPWVFHFGNDQPQNIAIPVCECGTDRIRPVIVLGTASESDKLTASVLTEQEMANKFGIGKYRFERDDDEWEYEDERSKVNVFFPDSAWPELKLVADRQWVVISLSNVDLGKDGFFSPKTFYVGIYGTDQVTPMITIVPNDALPPTTGFTPKNVFGVEVVLKGVDSDSECHFNPDFELWASGVEVEGHVPYEFDTDEENDDDEYGYLNVTAPAKGALYVKFESDWYLEDIQTGRLKFSGSVLDGGVSVVKKDGEWWGDGEVWGVLKTKSAGTVKISGYGEKLYIGGIWFKPDLVDLDGCLGTSALYQETVDLANDRHRVCYRCYVTGMGVAKFGDKATLVCHPNEGEVFDHWEFVNCEAPADATVTSPTLTFTATKDLYDQIDGVDGVPRCVAVRPVLKKRHQIVVIPVPCGAATVDGNGCYFEGDEATISLAAAEGCRFRSWGDGAESPSTRVFTADEDKVVYAYFDGMPVSQAQSLNLVPGEQSPFYTGFIGYTASGLPSGLKYDKTSGMITGAATKPTVAEGVVVTFRKTGEPDETLTVVVGPLPTVDVRMEGVNSDSDIQGCKVTGAKAYLVGARATLSATAPKGTAFMGWYRDGEPWPNAEEYRKTSLAYTMGKEDVALVAKFKKEVVTVGCDSLELGTFTAGVACGFGSGILLDEGSGITTESGVKSIAVNKLPAGMKFDARTHLLTGWPTKAGSNRVEVVVTANSGAVERKYIDIVVAALPAWAVGDFAGTVTCADGTYGTASMKVDAAGKVTNGKLLDYGTNWTFTASSYASSSVTRGLEQDYIVFATAKSGKAERQVELHVTGWAVEGVAENAAAAAGVFGDADVELWRNVWKDADAKGVLAGIAGKYTYFFADGTALPLDLTSAGALSGKANIRERDNASVSFATTVFASTNGVEAAFYVAPDAKKGYAEICERFVLVPESGEREPGVAHRNPGVIAFPESYPGDTGMGSVAVTPKGGQVDAGKTVTVSATPDSKSVFVKWRYEVGGETKYSELSKLTLTMDGEHDVFAYAVFRSRGSFKEPVVAVEDAERAKFAALELGVQFSAFVTVEDVENMKPVKWFAQYLPSGLKINAETGEISGVATAVNSKPVVITATSVANPQKKTTFTLDVGVGDGKPAALPETAVGTFAGFVTNGTDNVATFTFTSSDKGALSAKVVDASGTVSFSGAGFVSSRDGKYGVELETTKGERMTLTLDSSAGWDADQLTGTFTTAKGTALGVTSQRNAFSKAWYFAADGDAANGWTFAFTTDAKAAALTVTLKADGTTTLAGKLPNGVDKNNRAVTIPVSASGVANAGMMTGGALAADFAPVLTVSGKKKVLSVRTNLWFDRRNDHPDGIGGARFVE